MSSSYYLNLINDCNSLINTKQQQIVELQYRIDMLRQLKELISNANTELNVDVQNRKNRLNNIAGGYFYGNSNTAQKYYTGMNDVITASAFSNVIFKKYENSINCVDGEIIVLEAEIDNLNMSITQLNSELASHTQSYQYACLIEDEEKNKELLRK